MSVKKIVFLGSKPVGYNCFSYLLAQQIALNIEVIGLLTQTRKEFVGHSDLTKLANEHNIEIIPSLERLPECDIIYSVQYHQILSARNIKKARQAAVNLHMAPLPEYRGSNQFSYAIIDDKKEFGTTVHLMDTRIDHGDILFQKRFPIPENCWVNQLYDLTYNTSIELFEETLASVISGNYSPLPQKQLLGQHSTSLHYRNEIATLKQIDLAWEKDKIERHIRATFMPGFEPPYTVVNGQKIYFTQLPS